MLSDEIGQVVSGFCLSNGLGLDYQVQQSFVDQILAIVDSRGGKTVSAEELAETIDSNSDEEPLDLAMIIKDAFSGFKL